MCSRSLDCTLSAWVLGTLQRPGCFAPRPFSFSFLSLWCRAGLGASSSHHWVTLSDYALASPFCLFFLLLPLVFSYPPITSRPSSITLAAIRISSCSHLGHAVSQLVWVTEPILPTLAVRNLSWISSLAQNVPLFYQFIMLVFTSSDAQGREIGPGGVTLQGIIQSEWTYLLDYSSWELRVQWHSIMAVFALFLFMRHSSFELRWGSVTNVLTVW